MNKRNYNLDYLRILACIMVVVIHVASQTFSSVDVQSHEWFCFNLYGSMVRSAVPLFFIISGKLFLSREKCITIKDLFTKYVFKILVLYIIWSIIYAITRTVRFGLPVENLLTEIINSNFHLWYLPALIGLYLVIPVLWIVAHYEDGKYLRYCVIMFFVFIILKHTITSFEILDINIINLANKINYPLSTYTGYFLLGYYLDKNINKYSRYKQSVILVSIIITMMISGIITKTYSFYVGKPTTILYTNFSITVFIEAILLFIFFSRLNLNIKNEKNIIKLSKLTLFVYLFHPFVIDMLRYEFGITNLSFDPLYSIPVLSISVLLICLFFGYIFDKIPFINKWFM